MCSCIFFPSLLNFYRVKSRQFSLIEHVCMLQCSCAIILNIVNIYVHVCKSIITNVITIEHIMCMCK